VPEIYPRRGHEGALFARDAEGVEARRDHEANRAAIENLPAEPE
jgi:hypothetical protein